MPPAFVADAVVLDQVASSSVSTVDPIGGIARHEVGAVAVLFGALITIPTRLGEPTFRGVSPYTVACRRQCCRSGPRPLSIRHTLNCQDSVAIRFSVVPPTVMPVVAAPLNEIPLPVLGQATVPGRANCPDQVTGDGRGMTLQDSDSIADVA